MNISHDVEYKEQCKALERMAKRWLKEFGHFRVTFETIGDEEIGTKEKVVIREDSGLLEKHFSKSHRGVLDGKDRGRLPVLNTPD